ncbi:MAG: LPXTG cell wall anchor domain-containing protein, partial [Actinomycetota bacterium]
SWTLDKIGPICRSVEDCALVLQAIYGPDGRDPSVLSAPFDWTPRQPLKQSSSLPNTGTQLALLAAAALAVTGGAWAVRQKVTKR